VLFFFVTLAKIGLCWKFSLKMAIMKFYGNFSIGSSAFPRVETWAGMTEIRVTSRICIATSSINLMNL